MTGSEALRFAHQLLAERTTSRRAEHTEDPSRPETVQAMQIALHIPRVDPPPRTALLEAAARAVVLVCLDPRVAVEEQWRNGVTTWYDHLIRKVVRRARNKQWEDAQGVPGVTASVAGAEARAFLPGAVSDVPPAVKKLQIQGTDLPADPGSGIMGAAAWPMILLNADLGMSVGKAAAQAGHASMLLAAQLDFNPVREWAEQGFALTVRELPGPEFHSWSGRSGVVPVRDAGFTEVAPDALTALAVPAADRSLKC